VGDRKGRLGGVTGVRWIRGSEEGRPGGGRTTSERKTKKVGQAGATGWVEEPYRAEPAAAFEGSAAGWMTCGPDTEWSQRSDGWVIAVYTRSPQRGPTVGQGCGLGPFGITVAGCVVGLRQKRIVRNEESRVHIVTKILVIFGALFSVLLAALTIAFSTNADRLKEDVLNSNAARIAWEAKVKEVEGSQAAVVTNYQDGMKKISDTKADLEKANVSLQSERATLLADKNNAELSAASSKNQFEALTAVAKTNATTLASLTEEVNALRTALVGASKRENELVDRLNDEEARRQVLEQTTRALREELTDARTALDRVKSGVTDTAKGEAFVDRTGPIVQARVKKVMASPAGDELVEINEGSNARLRTNQKLSIIRDGKFIATLVLMQVEAQGSVGRVDKLGKTVTIMPEDMVLSRFE